MRTTATGSSIKFEVIISYKKDCPFVVAENFGAEI